MSGPWLPGYDAWKLATPPEYERDDDVCATCGGGGILEDECECLDDSCCCLHPRPPVCGDCEGDGRNLKREPDPDAAYDRMQAERNAGPGDVDYCPPMPDEDF